MRSFRRLVLDENHQHISCPRTCLININEQICAVTAGGFPDNILQGWFKMKTITIFRIHGLASLILMSKYAQSWQFLRGFPDNILQSWFKTKTTSMFPVNGLASLILMCKYAWSQYVVLCGGFLTICIFYKSKL